MKSFHETLDELDLPGMVEIVRRYTANQCFAPDTPPCRASAEVAGRSGRDRPAQETVLGLQQGDVGGTSVQELP
jgi:hypothetical protein